MLDVVKYVPKCQARVIMYFFTKRDNEIYYSILTHSHAITPFDAPGKQAF